MKHSVFCQTSQANITTLAKSYKVSVYCKVALNETLFLEMNKYKAFQSIDLVKQSPVCIDVMIPKAKGKDVHELLAIAECSALAHFIKRDGCNALGMTKVEPRLNDLNLVVSQSLTADLLASDIALAHGMVKSGKANVVFACDFAAAYFYPSSVKHSRIEWLLDGSECNEYTKVYYYDVSKLNQVEHNGETFIVGARTVAEFMNIPLYRREQDKAASQMPRPLHNILNLLTKAKPVRDPQNCTITQRTKTLFGAESFTLFSSSNGPTFIQARPKFCQGQWKIEVLGFRRLYSQETKAKLESNGYLNL